MTDRDRLHTLGPFLFAGGYALVPIGLTFAFHRLEARPAGSGLENVGGGRHHVEV